MKHSAEMRAELDAIKADLGDIEKLTLDEDPVQGVRNLITLRAEQDRALQAMAEKMDALTAEVKRLKGRIAEFIDGENSDG